jgi:hypothetical protein
MHFSQHVRRLASLASHSNTRWKKGTFESQARRPSDCLARNIGYSIPDGYFEFDGLLLKTRAHRAPDYPSLSKHSDLLLVCVLRTFMLCICS